MTISNVYQGGAPDVAVIGSVKSADLGRWVLDCGPGTAPPGWTEIGTGTAPVAGGASATWKTAPFANGSYTLRLRVWDTGGRVAEATSSVTLASFSVDQSVLEVNPASGGTVRYTSVVPFPLTETLLIKDQQGRVVRTLVSGRREAGTHEDSWDGRNDAGTLVPDGPCFYVATASDGTHTLTWDLSTAYLNNYFDSKEGLDIRAFDPFNNRPLTFHYTFPVPGLVTISFFNHELGGSDCDQPPEKALCVVNRRYQESGTHTFAWAGVDASGAYRGDAYSQVSVTIVRDRFARNAVVVFGTRPTMQNLRIDPPAFALGSGSPRVSFDLETYQQQSADVTVTFVSQASRSTLRTISLSAQPPGHLAVEWDGRADNGAWVAPGSYTITVSATDRIGNRVEGQVLASVQR